MKKTKTLLKYIFYAFLLGIGLLLLSGLLIQTPSVQQYLTERLEFYLEQQFQTTVRIQSIRLHFPESIAVKGVYIEDAQQDTLLNLSELLVNLKLNKLIQKKIQFDQLTLIDGKAKIYLGKDSSNIHFLQHSFAKSDTSQVEVKVENEKSAANWQLSFNRAPIELKAVDLWLLDEQSGFLLDGQLGHLSCNIHQLDDSKNEYQLGHLKIEDSKLHLQIEEEEEEEKEITTSTKTDAHLANNIFSITSTTIGLDRVAFDLALPTFQFNAEVEHLNGKELQLNVIGEELNLDLLKLEVHKGAFDYDLTDVATTTGFDYNHFGLKDVSFELNNLTVHNQDVKAQIVHLQGKNEQGLNIKKLKTHFDFNSNQINFQALELSTAFTNLQSTKTIIQFPSIADSIASAVPLNIQSDLIAKAKNLNDIRYFYSDIDRLRVVKNATSTNWALHSAIDGNLENLAIKKLVFSGLGNKIEANGRIKNLSNTNRLFLDLNLQNVKTTGQCIVELLPENSLREGASLPNNIQFYGKVKGSLNQFNTTITAKTSRSDHSSISQLNGTATIQNIQDLDRILLDIQIDTMQTSKADLLAYLPTNALPDYIDLPDQFQLKGRLKGPIRDLHADLQLATQRAQNGNQINIRGNISDLFTSTQTSLDLSLKASTFQPEDLRALFPDTLLPAYLRLPIINQITGFIKGDLNNFGTQFQMESNTGNWTVEGSLKNETYHLDLKLKDSQPAQFFTENYLDSLTGLSFSPWTVDATFDGQGFDFSKSSFSDFSIQIKNAADTSMTGLAVEGVLKDQLFKAQVIAAAKEMEASAKVQVDFTSELPASIFEINLKQFNLQQLLKTDTIPFVMAGQLKGNLAGDSWESLSGNLLATDVNLIYQDQKEAIDSLAVDLKLDGSQQFVNIYSDFFEAKIKGGFVFPRVIESMKQQVFSFWETNYPDSLIRKTNDHFTLDFKLYRPELLTMGYIPQLTELTPFQLDGSYDNREASFNIQTKLPFVHWEEHQFENGSLTINGKGQLLSYKIDVEKGNLQKTIALQNASLFGNINHRILENTLLLKDNEEEDRFEIKSELNWQQPDSIYWSFHPEQLLNYKAWNIGKKNRMLWSGNELVFNEWRLVKGMEAIEIEGSTNETLNFSFAGFDLALISDLVKGNNSFLGGSLNGDLKITNLSENMEIATNLQIDSLVVLNSSLGSLTIVAEKQDQETINASTTLQGYGNDVVLDGVYHINHKEHPFDFDIALKSLSLPSIEPLFLGHLKKMEGLLQGQLHLSGSLNQPLFTGQVQLKNAAFDVELAKTRFRLGTQPLVFDPKGIEFKDLEVFDINGNKGIVSSYLLTENYRDYTFQSDVEINNFQILNTTAKDNDLYYGKLLVDAKAKVTGSLTAPVIEITAKPKKGSQLTYAYSALSNGLELGEGTVRFITPDQEPQSKLLQDQLPPSSNELSIKTIVKLEVNEALNFIVITDPISGDFFEGKAKGDLVYIQNPAGKIELTGGLEVVEGEYLFTYQKLIRRPFKVKPGGTVNWTGDPYNPKMNIDIQYPLRTAVYPLIADQEESSSQSKRENFIVNLNLKGLLEESKINTSIEYPEMEGNTNNVKIRNAIDQINQDKGKQNTQAMALILFNGFLAQDLANSEFKVLDLNGNINNIINQQLNSLANRYIKFVELDIGVDSYEDADKDIQADFRVSIRKRFLNDRLSISLDGKTTTETNQKESQSQTYLDNITVEYSITPDGKFRLKMYNQREYDDFLGGATIKLGGALVFSKDFNRIRLFKKKDKKIE